MQESRLHGWWQPAAINACATWQGKRTQMQGQLCKRLARKPMVADASGYAQQQACEHCDRCHAPSQWLAAASLYAGKLKLMQMNMHRADL